LNPKKLSWLILFWQCAVAQIGEDGGQIQRADG
jgi:hypothetical protein